MNNITANILKSIEEKIEIGNRISFDILTAIRKMSDVLEKSNKGGSNNNILSSGFLSILKGDDKTKTVIEILGSEEGLKNLEKSEVVLSKIGNIIKNISDYINNVNPEKANAFMEIIGTGKKIVAFAIFLAIAAPLLLVSVLITLPLLLAWVLFFNFIDANSKSLADASKSLLYIAASTALVVLTLVATAFLIGNPANLFYSFLLVTGALLLITGAYILISMFSGTINNGVKSMIYIALTTAIIVAVILMSAYYIQKMDSGSVVGAFGLVMLSLLGVALTYYLISKVNSKVIEGTSTMLFVGLTTALIVGIVLGTAYLLQGLERDSVFGALGIVAFSILGLGLAMTMIGNMGTAPLQGAAAMLIVSAAIGVFAFSLIQFKKAGVTSGDVLLVSGSLTALGVAFTVIGNPITVGFTYAGAAAMLVVSASVLVYTSALKVFSESNWTEQKTELLSNSVVSLVGAFKEAFSSLSLKEFIKITAGIGLLSGIGASLAILGKGLSYFGNLEMVNYIEDPNNKGHMIVDPNSSPTSINPTKISQGIVALVTPLIGKEGILYKLGENEQGFWGKNPVGKGINLLSKLGFSLSSLAMGFSSFGNLEFSTQDNLLKGDKNSKKIKIDPKAIGQGIKDLVSPLVSESSVLADLGKNEGIIFSGNIGNGIKLLGKLGGSISQFAKGLMSMVELRMPVYDENGNLVKDKFTKLPDNYAEQVGLSIKNMVNALITPLDDLGSRKSGFFSSSTNFEKGLEFLTDISKPLSSLSNIIVAFSKSKKINSTEISASINSILNPISGFFDSKNLQKLDAGKGEKILSYATEYINNLKELEKPEKIGSMFTEISKSVNSMDLTKLKELNSLSKNLAKFAEEMEGNFSDLSEVIDKLSKSINNIPSKDININQNVKSIGTTNSSQINSVSQQKEKETQVAKMETESMIKELKAILNTLQGGIEVEVKNSNFFK